MSDETPTDGFRPNWLAIWATILFLIVIGYLVGVLSQAPDGSYISCPEEDMVQIYGTGGDGVRVYCEPYED